MMTDGKREDTKVGTLDPVVGDTDMQHKLRPLLRNIYMKREHEDTRNARHDRIKHFGMIDDIPDESPGENNR